MWINDLSVAMAELFEVYGMYCCVERIANNVITMSNFEKWRIDSNGHIHRIEV